MSTLFRWSIGTVAALAMAGAAAVGTAWAKGEETPKPKVDCSKKANKGKAACKKASALSDDELFYAGYWLSRAGEHKLALHYLGLVRNPHTARVLTYVAYSTRKLGDWDKAMDYYGRALAADPDYTIARAYLGAALLERGHIDKARAELAEIERRCGAECVEYHELAHDIAAFETKEGG